MTGHKSCAVSLVLPNFHQAQEEREQKRPRLRGQAAQGQNGMNGFNFLMIFFRDLNNKEIPGFL